MTFPAKKCSVVKLIDGTEFKSVNGKEIEVDYTYGEDCGLGSINTEVERNGTTYKKGSILIPITSILFFVEA